MFTLRSIVGDYSTVCAKSGKLEYVAAGKTFGKIDAL